MLDILGYAMHTPNVSNEDKLLYNSYITAKKNKDFARSDALRNELLKKGLYWPRGGDYEHWYSW